MKRLDWADRFYRSKRWKDFRLALIRERGIRCEMCGKMMRSEADIQADHIQELTPESVNDINVSFNPANSFFALTAIPRSTSVSAMSSSAS